MMENIALHKRVSVKDFSEMQFDDNDDFQYEIINGEMIRKSAPSPVHQEVLKNLLYIIETHNRLEKKGRLFCAPIDVFLDDYNKLQPDLFFISEKKKSIITNDGIMGVPDLVIEIISPTSVIRDRIEKKNVYERFAIPEFWLVDPQYQAIEIYTLKNNRYELFSAATAMEGGLNQSLFEGLSISFNDVFASAL